MVEIDKHILRVIGHEFASNRRVHLHQADAFKWEPGQRRYQYAWHDVWVDGPPHISVLHTRPDVPVPRRLQAAGSMGDATVHAAASVPRL